jgi:ABC-type bacteriocin/lantibiotic exporter with double-glycine peptidase domain
VQAPQHITRQLNRLWHHISRRRRGQFGLLLGLMVLASLAEIVSIGAVLPFLAVLTVPDRIFGHPAAQPFIQLIGLTSADQLLLPLTIAFALAALAAGAMRVTLVWLSVRIAYATGSDLSVSIYRRTLHQPYAVHIARNSSQVISGIITKVGGVIHQVINPVLTLITSAIMFVAILLVLLSIDPKVTLFALVVFGVIYLLIIKFTKVQKHRNGERIALESTHVVKSLQEGLGGIRDVLLDGSQATYCDAYRSADIALRRSQGDIHFVNQSPRYVIEALGIALIAGLAYVLAKQPDGIGKAIPVMGALAIGAQRLLPLMQNAYVAWSSIQGGQASFHDTLDLLDQPLPAYADQPPPDPIPFHRHIRLNHVSFRYAPQLPPVLENLNLVIAKGSRVGLIGATGCGKSTLIDIVMGLLSPTQGSLEIDDQAITVANHRSWQAHIAHVPQAIFLTDSTIEENIAFGVPANQIDRGRVKRAAQQAQIADVIETWPKQYRTLVGERGIRLSGGQRQRIGIARALYKRADVIVFDEATSALDNETEQAVMQAIEGLSADLTILIIAHRLTTLSSCTQIVELSEGCVKRVGTYEDIVGRPA